MKITTGQISGFKIGEVNVVSKRCYVRIRTNTTRGYSCHGYIANILHLYTPVPCTEDKEQSLYTIPHILQSNDIVLVTFRFAMQMICICQRIRHWLETAIVLLSGLYVASNSLSSFKVTLNSGKPTS